MSHKLKKRYLLQRVKIAASIMAGVVLMSWLHAPGVWAYPIAFEDSAGKQIVINQRPQRVVSIVPSVTEMILRIGAGDALQAVTYHDVSPSVAALKDRVGGFFSPSIEKIKAKQPDVIFLSGLQKEVEVAFQDTNCILIDLETRTISDSYEQLNLLGRIFDREAEANQLVQDIQAQLDVMAKKVAKIPEAKRKRVMRLMGREQVMTPGADSFQNDMIRRAGGIPPDFGKKGAIVPVTLAEWTAFNPQVLYGCGGDRQAAQRLLDQPGWRDVEAVKAGNILYFPCDLTCRAATHTDLFVSWLSANIYTKRYADKTQQVLPNKVLKNRTLDLEMPYVQQARIVYSHLADFTHKTLLIDFDQPMAVHSTLHGFKENISTIGNHYSPPPYWRIGHSLGQEIIGNDVRQTMGLDPEQTCFLMTGANMDGVSIQQASFKGMSVLALVTAGVRSNAVRSSRDSGNYYEPGTINILLLPNMKLSPRAMARAVITATEAKTAALLDLDVRSTYLPRRYKATGTGTDNILVAQGTGTGIDLSGGHSKMGELIAKCVYRGVREAIFNQNGMVSQRSIYQRLRERNLSIFGVIDRDCPCGMKRGEFIKQVELILLEPRYSNFLEAALALSDEHEKGLLKDTSPFSLWCRQITEDIAGRPVKAEKELVVGEGIPVVLEMALEAILNGVYYTYNE
jgi:adenosylcobinamide amidohydrolase/ABC-type Fe3+-hydroxamate transport system substrate-binding protein